MADRPLSLFERTQHRAARALMSLSPSTMVRLAGGVPIERAGQTLHPEMQLLLSLRKKLGAPTLEDLAPSEARRLLRREGLVHAGDPARVREVRDIAIPVPHGTLAARHYVPDAGDTSLDDDRPAPLLVFFHGGGFVLGDIDTHDGACRVICRHAGVHVLSVAYRLAPESPFPAAVDDALAGFAWARANVRSLGADPTRIGIGGDSAGGNLAAVVTQIVARTGESLPAMQLLIYPAVDRTKAWPSMKHFGEGFFLSKKEMDWFLDHYAVSSGADVSDPRISPLLAEDLSGLPPALVVTAAFDPLRDEGEAYADALRAAGNTVVARRVDGLVHGFINMIGVSRVSRDALIEIAGGARTMFAAHHGSSRA